MLSKLGLLLSLALVFTSASNAELYRLDFSGVLTHAASTETGDYSDGSLLAAPLSFAGYLILDLTTPVSAVSDSGATYWNMTVAGGVTVASTSYVLDTSGDYVSATGVSTLSEAGGQFFYTYDQYYDAEGNYLIFGQLFRSQIEGWYSGINLPGIFSLDDVDPFDPAERFSTHASLFQISTDSGMFEYGAYTSVDFQPVPVPGAVILMLSALGVLGVRKRS